MNRNQLVFIISFCVVALVATIGITMPGLAEEMAGLAFDYLITKFGWFYLVSVTLFLIFCIFLMVSPYRKIRLGDDDSHPEFSSLTWFAMLFSAGMAIGLIFWGVAEPLSHYLTPPHGLAQPGSHEAVVTALRYSFFHWGFHAWANYALFALAIAYFQQRKGYPGLVSSIFIPIIGEEKVQGPIGMSIDVLAIFATVTGIATDFGLGAMQINSGLERLYQIPYGIPTQTIIILVATVCFMLSAVRGINKGIKLLSDLNFILCILLMVLVFLVGPKLEIIRNFFMGSAAYLSNIGRDSIPVGYLKSDAQWLGNWTVFYWAWWIAWTPFVGSFIARISKGRTIGGFMMGVLVFPVLGSMVWFSLFGTLSTYVDVKIGEKAITSIATAYFDIIGEFPLSGIISFLTVILLFIFFVTSADSSTFVLGIFSSNGDPNPSTRKKVMWGLIQAFLGLSLLVAGGLEVIQTANIVVAFPFAIIMVGSMISLGFMLKKEKIPVREHSPVQESLSDE